MSLTISLCISPTYVRRPGCAVERPAFGVLAGIKNLPVALSQQFNSMIRFVSAYDQLARCCHLRASVEMKIRTSTELMRWLPRCSWISKIGSSTVKTNTVTIDHRLQKTTEPAIDISVFEGLITALEERSTVPKKAALRRGRDCMSNHRFV